MLPAALALTTPERVEPPPRLLRRPLAELGSERTRQPALGGVAFAPGRRLGRLAVQRCGDACGAALVGEEIDRIAHPHRSLVVLVLSRNLLDLRAPN